MNAIFTVIIISSAIALCFIQPNSFLSAMIDGARGACATALTLFCIYAVWMGLSQVAEDAGLNKKLSRLLEKPCAKLFKTENEEATQNLAMNISCNLLGIGGAATPFAVKAVEALEKDGNSFAQNLLFIINATSIQIIPTTVIALRAAAGSANAGDIILPSLIASAISTVTAALIYRAVNKKWRC